ncbi:MAG TPA: carboxylesterase, partial [Denitromonas sp.]|nr:carboxylesterase [Denitromonas sp.]
VLALSTYLPLADTLAAEASEANRDVPIFMAHGRDDGVIPHDFAQQSFTQLKAAGYPITWQTYFVEHGIVMEEIRDVEQWLVGVLVR